MHFADYKKPKTKSYIFHDSIYISLTKENVQGEKTDQGFLEASLWNQRGLAGLITTLNLVGE